MTLPCSIYSAPFSAAAEFAHPLETLGLGVGFFLPVLLLTNHLFFVWAWLFVREMQTYEVHSGYDIPFSPTKLLPFYGGARFHDYHHEAFNANYASTFTILDQIFGTSAGYNAREQKRKSNPPTVPSYPAVLPVPDKANVRRDEPAEEPAEEEEQQETHAAQARSRSPRRNRKNE